MEQLLQRLPRVRLLHLAEFELEPLADRQVAAFSRPSQPSSGVRAVLSQPFLSSDAQLSSPVSFPPLSLLSFGAVVCPVLLLCLVTALAEVESLDHRTCFASIALFSSAHRPSPGHLEQPPPSP